MPEEFRLKVKELRTAVEGNGPDVGTIDRSTNADEVAAILLSAQRAGILGGPPGLEIQVYPDSVAEGDRVLITVFSVRRPYAHVAASAELIYKLGAGAEDEIDRTVEAITTIVATASRVVPAVRLLEHQRVSVGPCVYRHARCPRCGEHDQLRVEYRYDVLGLDPEGELISGDPEQTELLCLACGNEIERAEPVDPLPPNGADSPESTPDPAPGG